MGLILPILVLGMLASLSPSTIVVFILLLGTARARANAAAFLIGWGASLTVVFVAAYVVGGTHDASHGNGRVAVEVLEILLGLGLAAVATRQWRTRHVERKPSALTQRLNASLDRLNPVAATMVGVVSQPWTLTAAAAVLVVRHHSALLVVVAAFAVFTVVSTATVGALYLYFARRPGEAQAHLTALRDRVVAAGPAVFAAVTLLVGLYLIVDGALGLAGT